MGMKGVKETAGISLMTDMPEMKETSKTKRMLEGIETATSEGTEMLEMTDLHVIIGKPKRTGLSRMTGEPGIEIGISLEGVETEINMSVRQDIDTEETLLEMTEDGKDPGIEETETRQETGVNIPEKGHREIGESVPETSENLQETEENVPVNAWKTTSHTKRI